MQEIFDGLNVRYFGDQLERPLLTWSKVTARRILGHHDHVHGTITLSRALDSARIPKFVVEYVLYHEMLHHHMGGIPDVAGRTVYHSRAFRAAEARYPWHREALAWEKENLPQLLRASQELDRQRRLGRQGRTGRRALG